MWTICGFMMAPGRGMSGGIQGTGSGEGGQRSVGGDILVSVVCVLTVYDSFGGENPDHFR